MEDYNIEKKPFVRYDEEVKEKPIPVRLNEEERALLDKSKKIIEQSKDSTALKQLAWIGAKVLHEQKMEYILATIFANKRKNKRSNVFDFD